MTLPHRITTYLRNPAITPPHLWHLIDDPQTTFDQLQLDALAPVEIALLIEEETGCEIPDNVLERWRCLDDVFGCAKQTNHVTHTA